MSQQDPGIAIHRSVKLIEQAGREINSLSELVKREFNSIMENDSLNSMIKITENWTDITRDDDLGWVCTDFTFSLGFGHKKGKSKTQRWLCVQISLAGDGMTTDSARNEEPLIHINFWADKIDFDEIYMGLDLTNNDVLLQDGFFFNWKPGVKHWFEQEWTFSLKLVSINTINDIQQSIIKPFIKLVQGNSHKDSGLAELPGLVRYEETSRGYYRVISDLKTNN